MDYETYIIGNCSRIRDDNISQCTATHRYSDRSPLHHRQDDCGAGTEQRSAQQPLEHQPQLSRRHTQLSRHRRLRMALSQQADQAYAQRTTVEALQGGLLLLPPHRLEQQHLHIQHIQQVSQAQLSSQPPSPALLRQARQAVQVRQEVEARQEVLRKGIQAQQEVLRQALQARQARVRQQLTQDYHMARENEKRHDEWCKVKQLKHTKKAVWKFHYEISIPLFLML